MGRLRSGGLHARVQEAHGWLQVGAWQFIAVRWCERNYAELYSFLWLATALTEYKWKASRLLSVAEAPASGLSPGGIAYVLSGFFLVSLQALKCGGIQAARETFKHGQSKLLLELYQHRLAH